MALLEKFELGNSFFGYIKHFSFYHGTYLTSFSSPCFMGSFSSSLLTLNSTLSFLSFSTSCLECPNSFIKHESSGSCLQLTIPCDSSTLDFKDKMQSCLILSNNYIFPVCGDGKRQGIEGCDDGGMGGCDDKCVANKKGYYCSIRWLDSVTPQDYCQKICGDGIKVEGEECDLGIVQDLGCLDCKITSGYWCSEKSCVSCGDGCLKCLNATACLNCKEGVKKTPEGKCYNECPQGLYANASDCFYCKDAMKDCSVCSDKSLCQKCSGSLFALGASCLSVCPVNSFISNGVCGECLAYCQKCSDSFSCIECISGYYLLGKATCVNNCGDYKYISNDLKECSSCMVDCKTCKDSLSCQSCSDELILSYGKNSCLKLCPEGQVTVTNLNVKQCEPCDLLYTGFKCKTCNMEGCISCSSGSYLTEDFRCVTTCSKFYYPSPSSGKCLLCPENCETCSENSLSSIICSLCKDGYYILSNKCLVQCPPSYYSNKTKRECQPCLVEKCLSCSESPSTCVYCEQFTPYYESTSNKCYSTIPSGYFLYKFLTLQKCISNCDICLAISTCLKCLDSYFLEENNCVASCSKGYYTDVANRRCIKCICTYCEKCDSTLTFCQHCENGYFRLETAYSSACQTDCGVRFSYNKIDNVCLKCNNDLCQCCMDGPDKCSVCSNGYKVYMGTCINTNCPNKYAVQTFTNTSYQCSPATKVSVTYYQCMPCLDLGCEICTTPSKCSLCSTGYTMYLSACRPKKPDGFYYKDDKTLAPCSEYCELCMDITGYCTQCAYSYTLINNKCMTYCSDSLYESIRQSYCADNPTCEANLKISCNSCMIPFYQEEGNTNSVRQCVSQCAEGWGSEKKEGYQVCYKCIEGCKICQERTKCEMCSSGKLLGGLCVTQCPLGHFENNEKCVLCSDNCVACHSTSCDQCEKGYYKLDKTVSNQYICSIQLEGYYIESTATILNKCMEFCVACLSANDCQNPLVGYFFIEHLSKCSNLCPSNTYVSGTNCRLCSTFISNCNECKSDANLALYCTSCISPYFLQGNICVLVCTQSYATDTLSNKCILCPMNSDSCYFESSSNIVIVSKCKNGYFILEKTSCISQCPSYYYKTDISCEKCKVDKCMECENEAETCLKCEAGFSISADKKNCKAKCDNAINEFSNSAAIIPQCILCSIQNCQLCKDLLHCTVCNENFYLLMIDSSTCVTKCPPTYFPSRTYPLQCLDCFVANCQMCSTDLNKCQKCFDSYVLSSDLAICDTKCLSNEYIEIIDSSKKCQKCPINCSQCLSSSTCKACTAPYLLYGTVCVPSCPDSYFSDINICISCSFACLKCSSSAVCLKCNQEKQYYLEKLKKICTSIADIPIGFYANVTLGTVEPCSIENCESCNSFDKCQTCKKGFYLDSLGATCHDKCKGGFGKNNDTGACDLCQVNDCYNCDFNNTGCLKCNEKLFLDLERTICQENCRPGTYGSIEGVCKSCSENCLTCNVSSGCSTCFSPYLLFQSQCVSVCPKDKGMFANKEMDICQKCTSYCKECVSSSICGNCLTGFELASNGTCTLISGYFIYDDIAFKCIENCSKCSNVNSCELCDSNSILLKGKCYQKCNAGMYMNQDGTCKSCTQPCLECTSSEECIKCPDEFQLIFSSNLSSCLRSCLPSFYPSLNFPYPCLSCPPACETCISASICTKCRPFSFFFENNCFFCASQPGFTHDCQEICGDGLSYAKSKQQFPFQNPQTNLNSSISEICDDGNVNNGDGCSSDCQVEPFFKCYRANFSTPDVCWDTRPFNITLYTTRGKEEEVGIMIEGGKRTMKKYEEEELRRIMEVNITDLDEKLYQVGFNYDEKKGATIIRFNYSVSITGGLMRIKFIENKKERRRVLQEENLGLSDTFDIKMEIRYLKSPLFFELPAFTIYTQQQKDQIQAIKAVNSPATISFVVSTGPLYIFNTFSFFWLMVDCMQIANFFLYVNYEYPQNLEEYLKILSNANLDFLPNPFDYITGEKNEKGKGTRVEGGDNLTQGDKNEQYQLAPTRFAKLDMTSSFLKNSGAVTFWLFVAILGCVAIILADDYFKKSKQTGRVQIYMTKLREGVEYNFLLRVFLMVFLQLTLGSLLQTRNPTFHSSNDGFSSILGVFSTIFLLVTFVILFRIVSRLKDAPRSFKEKFDILYEDYKKENLWQCNYPVIALLKKFLMVFILVFFHDFPSVEIVSLALLHLLHVLLLFIIMPFERRLTNAIMIITEFVFAFVFVLVGYLLSLEDEGERVVSEETVQRKIAMGWSIIIMVSTVLFMYLLVFLRQQFLLIKTLIIYLRDFKGKYEQFLREKSIKHRLQKIKLSEQYESQNTTQTQTESKLQTIEDHIEDDDNPKKPESEGYKESSFAKIYKIMKNKQKTMEVDLEGLEGEIKSQIEIETEFKQKKEMIKNTMMRLKERRKKEEYGS